MEAARNIEAETHGKHSKWSLQTFISRNMHANINLDKRAQQRALDGPKVRGVVSDPEGTAPRAGRASSASNDSPDEDFVEALDEPVADATEEAASSLERLDDSEEEEMDEAELLAFEAQMNESRADVPSAPCSDSANELRADMPRAAHAPVASPSAPNAAPTPGAPPSGSGGHTHDAPRFSADGDSSAPLRGPATTPRADDVETRNAGFDEQPTPQPPPDRSALVAPRTRGLEPLKPEHRRMIIDVLVDELKRLRWLPTQELPGSLVARGLVPLTTWKNLERLEPQHSARAWRLLFEAEREHFWEQARLRYMQRAEEQAQARATSLDPALQPHASRPAQGASQGASPGWQGALQGAPEAQVVPVTQAMPQGTAPTAPTAPQGTAPTAPTAPQGTAPAAQATPQGGPLSAARAQAQAAAEVHARADVQARSAEEAFVTAKRAQTAAEAESRAAAARAELERQHAEERREAERLEAERRLVLQREAERLLVQRRQAERLEAERRLALQPEAARPTAARAPAATAAQAQAAAAQAEAPATAQADAQRKAQRDAARRESAGDALQRDARREQKAQKQRHASEAHRSAPRQPADDDRSDDDGEAHTPKEGTAHFTPLSVKMGQRKGHHDAKASARASRTDVPREAPSPSEERHAAAAPSPSPVRGTHVHEPWPPVARRRERRSLALGELRAAARSSPASVRRSEREAARAAYEAAVWALCDELGLASPHQLTPFMLRARGDVGVCGDLVEEHMGLLAEDYALPLAIIWELLDAQRGDLAALERVLAVMSSHRAV